MLRPRTEWEEFLEKRKSKSIIFMALVSLGFALLVLRLAQLQIMEHTALSHRADSNRIREVTLDGRRGKIFDRRGVPLVDSRPSFQLSLIPEDVENPRAALEFLSGRIEFDLDSTLEKVRKSRSFEPVVIKRDIQREEVAFAEENRLDLPGVFLQIKAIRNYIHGNFASHLFGYLGAITPEQYEKEGPAVYSRDDFVGKSGIEKVFEKSLRGEKGLKRVEVDAAGRELAQLGAIPPKSGQDITLALDYEAQTAAERAFEDKMGAAIALDPNTGDVLAFVSKPSYDPNVFARGISFAKWNELREGAFHPLQNRAIQGMYPPGSTFKIVVAAAGLEEGIVSEETTIFCPGHFTLGRRTYRCWKKVGHGHMTVHDALVQSCDVFFYNVGLKLGINKIAAYAKRFGLGRPTGIDMLNEKPGLIPTTKWKEKNRNEPWIMGETVSCSIGQGYVLATPLQQAGMIAAVANGGTLVKPKILLDGARPPSGEAVADTSENSVSVAPETLDIIRRALRGVVAEPHGTAWRLKKGPYSYAGKTGTSQVIRMKHDDPEDMEDIEIRFRDHAWFVAYAPSDNPKIAVAVIAEHAGHGGDAAAPIAKKIMDAYLDKIGAPRLDGVGAARQTASGEGGAE